MAGVTVVSENWPMKAMLDAEIVATNTQNPVRSLSLTFGCCVDILSLVIARAMIALYMILGMMHLPNEIEACTITRFIACRKMRLDP